MIHLFTVAAFAFGAVAQARAGLSKARTLTTLTTTGTANLDLTNKGMVVRGSAAAAAGAQITFGVHGGAWNRAGIISSTAAAHINGLTAIGYACNALRRQ